LDNFGRLCETCDPPITAEHAARLKPVSWFDSEEDDPEEEEEEEETTITVNVTVEYNNEQ